jgi:hypothetical protein
MVTEGQVNLLQKSNTKQTNSSSPPNLNTQLALHLISIFGYDMRARSAGNGAKVSTIPSFSAAEPAAPSGQRACG